MKLLISNEFNSYFESNRRVGAGIGEVDADHILAAGEFGQDEGNLVESGILADVLVQPQHAEGFHRLASGALNGLLAVEFREVSECAF